MKILICFSTALAFASVALAAPAQNAPAAAGPALQPVPFQAQPLPLSDVRLTGGPLGHAQELDAKYLLELEPDRMLYWLRVRAGVTNKTDAGSTSKFGFGDITDLSAFARRLSSKSDAVSAFLSGQLDAKAQAALAAYETEMNADELEPVLIENLNRIIAGPSIYEEKRFQEVSLRPETEDLRKSTSEGHGFMRLNRLLLEDAYRRELSRLHGGYGGWDAGATRQLTGHIAGHYLSAISYMYAATGNPEFKRRIDYMVNELKEIQDKQGDGYIGALMASPPRGGGGAGATAAGARRGRGEVLDGKGRFEAIAQGTIQSGGFDLNGMWSPWYVEHKIFAGLRDAYHYTGNRTALEVEIKFAGWVESIVGKLTDAQDQRMLSTEFGGMNEVLADLYHDTGDARWLAVSDKFEHKAIVDPLAQHNDILGGKHGNTLVPKMIGELSRYVYTGNQTDGDAARFFWEQVAWHHSYASGGHGHDEYFDPPDKLSNHVDGRDDESCNVYNMLKMTRQLFALHPDERYADFLERALFNHVLGSIDPKDGRLCYMVPVGRGVTHEYQSPFGDFTCCVGTGMESHALHGDGIFYESRSPGADPRLWVNFYTPCTADWKKEQVKLDMQTAFPEGETASLKITLQEPARKFTLALRRPSWAGLNFSVTVNGQPVPNLPKPGSYVEINRSWKSGDTVALVLPKELHEEPLPDNPRRVALLWGPLVLAGDLGPERRGRNATNNVPVLVSAKMPMTNWLKPVADKPGDFESVGVGRDKDVQFAPFYRLHERTYALYWDTFTPEEWNKQSPEFAAQAAREEKLKLATVGFAQPGQMQAERDANEQASSADESTTEQTMGHYGRRGTKWFSFDLPVDPAHPMTLVCTYYADEWRKRTADVLVDGQKVGEQVIEARGEPKFYHVEYKIPAALVEGKTKVTVRFEATQGNEIGAVYGLRTIRAELAP